MKTKINIQNSLYEVKSTSKFNSNKGKKETFDSLKNVIKETKKVMESQPKIEQLFNDVGIFTT